jgi:hypothetical protein
MRKAFVAVLCFAAVASALLSKTRAQETPAETPPLKQIEDDGMSPMGHRAAVAARKRAEAYLRENGLVPRLAAATADEPDPCDDNGCDGGEEEDSPSGTQSETAIAIDVTGQHVVVAYNDFRGFLTNPLSVSGFAYSDDGGATFVDGGQLPVSANGHVGTMNLPQVSGDPDVKYVGGCTFIYSSILVVGQPAASAPNFTGTAQTMGLHRSTDCGHTWTGPFEIAPATNPHGLLSGSNALDAADKEFLDVDPETGRVMLSWSNFTSSTFIPGFVEIRTAYSDDVLAGNPPTWSPGVVVNPGSATFDTGSMPRFARNSGNVYVAWASSSLTTGLSNLRVATSTDNGVTWRPPVTLNAADFFPIDQILGNDRVHSFPGVAVGPEGNVYVFYANNNSHDGSDIAFHRSLDGGATFSPAVLLNGRPGADRSQWFPYATADPSSGRIYVSYYDQGVAPSGDLTDATFQYSDDGGVTWSKPSSLMSAGCVGVATDPLDCRPFHGGYGNDTSQPNLGDYIGATTFGGRLYAVWAATSRTVRFDDGQPDPSGFFTVPDFYVNSVTTAQAALALGPITLADSGGNGLVDAGDQVTLKVPLRNIVTNPIDGPVTYTGVAATLSTSTPGVTVLAATRAYPNIAPNATATNTADFVYRVSPTFVPGTKIEFLLNATSAQGTVALRFRQDTGTPTPTTIFAENFNGVAPGALPLGWTTIHAGGANTVPWTTNSSFCGTSSNALFHINAKDNGSANPTRFERVATPNITIPTTAQYVTLDFDICYDTEDDPSFNVLAYDGALLRITDFTPGRVARANLAEAFAEVITTGSIFHYPKHNPRSSSTAYFQDMSMWAGDSGGFKHVSMRLPGMEGSTVQLRPDFTQDSGFTCTDVRPTHTLCGVMIDNIVMKSVVTRSDELLKVVLTPDSSAPGSFVGVVSSQAVAGAGGIAVSLSGAVSSGSIALPAGVVIPAGSTVSPSFSVTVTGAVAPATGTVTATGPSNARSAGIKIL